MKVLIALCLISVTTASHYALDYGHHAPVHHHIPSGSIGVSHDGAVIAGPSGSIHTDNGLHGHGAGAVLSGPAGEVGTHGGHAHLSGPGIGHHDDYHHVAPVVVAVDHYGHGHGGWDHDGHDGWDHDGHDSWDHDGHDGWDHGDWGHGEWDHGDWGHEW